MTRWGMVIDVRRCVGCQTCTIACKQEHGLPAGTAWRFVADIEVGEYPNVRRLFLPMQCMHCAEPPCVPVCPTGASRQREDGIVWVDRKSTRLNSSHGSISYAVFCLKKKICI